jgi:hypothetical protein
MPTKIRNVELLTLARSDAGTPVLGHVGVGIDANLIQDFEMGLSRVGSAAQFNLALNVEGATTNTAHYGGIAFTQGASADTIMASIKAVNTSVDGYVDLSFNTRSVSNALVIKADGKVGIGSSGALTYGLTVQAASAASVLVGSASAQRAILILDGSGNGDGIGGDYAWLAHESDGRLNIENSHTGKVITLGGNVGVGTGSDAPEAKLHIEGGTSNVELIVNSQNAQDNSIRIGYGPVGSATDVGTYLTHAHADNNFKIDNKGAPNSIITLLTRPSSGGSVERVRISKDGEMSILTGGSSSPSGINGLHLMFDTTDSNSWIKSEQNGTSNRPMNFLASTYSFYTGNVGIGTGSSAPSELLEVNGNAKATKFIGALEGNADTVTTNANLTGDITSVGNATSIAAGVIVNADVKSDAAIAYSKLGTIPTWNQNTTGNASTATALVTTRAITIGPAAATLARDDAGNIAQLSNNFNGGAAISFDSKLALIHPMNSSGASEGTDLRAALNSNETDESSNTAVKLIGGSAKVPVLKINRQGVIVGFDEASVTTGSGGSFAGFDVTLHNEIYFNSALDDQAQKTISASNSSFNLYFKSSGLFTSLTESGGTMSVTVGGTTKTLALPNASFTQFQRISSTQLQATVGATQLTADLSGASVANATNATNAANVAIAANATNATRYLTFVTGSSGNLPLLMDTGITYNPSSNTLATTTFSGALSGNATTSSGLLIGSTTYLPSTSAASTNSLVARNASSQVHIKELVLSDNTTSSSLSMFIGKISGSDILHEFSGGQALALLGVNTIFTGNGPYAISITGNAATATTAAACSGNAATATVAASTTKVVAAANATNADQYVAFLDNANTTAQQVLYDAGITYNPSSNTLSTTTFAGALSGNASSATGLVWSGATRSPSSAATANTIAVRGSGGALTIAGLTCTTVGATTMSAQSLELTNQGTGTNFSLKAHNIVPRGTVAYHSGGYTLHYVPSSSIGDHANPSVGAFDRISAFSLYFRGGLVFSDRKLKENISPFELGLDFVRLLEPKSYNWIGSKTPRKYYGAIAQEIAEAMEEVGIEDESMISIRGHHKKTEAEREESLKTYDSQQIMWVLFNAVKQLDAEVQDLKKELKK